MTKNLMSDRWRTNVESAELRLLLDSRFGGPGQYEGILENPNTIYLPLARESCEIELTFSKGKIVAIEPGQVFDAAKWRRFCDEVEKSLFGGRAVFGRDFSFSGFRVTGFWRGEHSGVQILPPPDDAPIAPVEMADHPFILEFPLSALQFPPGDPALWRVTNYRRIREHRRMARLLNILLAGGTSLQPRRPEHFWAVVPPNQNPNDIKIQWVQQFFFGRLDQIVVERLSPPTGGRLEEIPPQAYYGVIGHDGKGLRVPTDLDESICRYLALSRSNREKFDRATFWMDLASRQWANSVSSSFGSLVSAVESLTERGDSHRVYCEQCGCDHQLEVPGATERFRAFVETYAPGAGLKHRRNEMYDLRSGIFHGSKLMQFDQDLAFGAVWDPPDWNERELHRELWALAETVLRNWLKNAPEPRKRRRRSVKPRHPDRDADVAVAAYFIWENSGCEHGHDLEHWFAAKQQLGRRG
jgi:hypothetical protein